MDVYADVISYEILCKLLEDNMKKIIVLLTTLVVAFSLANAKNPVVVATDSTGDFTSIQAAISSWCAGGANVSATAPFVIQIKGGTYKEKLSLNDARIGLGDIVGDIKIMAYDTTNIPIIKIPVSDTTMSNPSTATRQGLMIHQNVANVELRDLVFTYALETSTEYGVYNGMLNGNLIKIDENSANVSINTVKMINCVVTAVSAAGEPLVKSKTEALSGNFYSLKTTGLAGGVMVSHYNDPGESLCSEFINCTFYGSASYGLRTRLEGSVPERALIKDCLFKDFGYYPAEFDGNNSQGTVVITGTKPAKDGDLYNSTVMLNTGIAAGGGHFVYSATTGAVLDLSNMICHTRNVSARMISIGNTSAKITDSIFFATNYGIVHNNAAGRYLDIQRCTFVTDTQAASFFLPSGTQNGGFGETSTHGAISFVDTIIAGRGNKFNGLTAIDGKVSLSNVLLPTLGDYSVYSFTTTGIALVQNIYTDDPGFASADPTSVDFFDVTNTVLIGKSSTGTVLAGGANFKSAVYLIGPANVTLGATDTIVANNGVAPYTWQSSNTTVGTITGTGATVTFNALALGSTDVTVTDAAGGTNKITVNVIATSAPLASEMME